MNRFNKAISWAVISLGAGSLLTGAASAQELSRQLAGSMPTVADRHNGLGYRAG